MEGIRRKERVGGKKLEARSKKLGFVYQAFHLDDGPFYPY